MGRVKNIKTEKILKQSTDKRRYCRASLYKDGKVSKFSIHRLVAQEFVDNPERKLYIDHMDRNSSNNCINNLRWVGNSQNRMNRTKSSNKSSAFKGVSFNKKLGRWN